jgi:hypothetical protein
MTLRSFSFSAVLAAGLLARFASAQTIDAVQSSNDPDVDNPPVAASVGSVLTITGSGFGTAKPKVFLTDEASKKYTLKVTEFDDTHIVAQIKKAVAGDLTLNVQLKGVTDPLTAAVQVEEPQIDELLDADMITPITSAEVNTEFVISGSFFGTKKGKVKIGGKAAKVLEWADDMVHVVMPKTVANGQWPIALDNKIAVNDGTSVTTTGSNASVGKVGLTVTFGTGPGAETIKFNYSAGGGGVGLVGFAGTTSGLPNKTITVIFPFNGTVPSTIDSQTDAGLIVTYNLTEKPLFPPHIASWFIATGTAGLVLHVTASGGGGFAGDFEGDLPIVTNQTGHAVDDPLHVKGTFVFQQSN